MKTVALVAMIMTVAAGVQPGFAATAAKMQACMTGQKICHCGTGITPFWTCCHAKLKCDCTGGLPNCAK